MTGVHVNLDERSYDIQVGCDLPVGDTLAGKASGRVLIVTDSNVGPKHAQRISDSLRARGFDPVVATVPAGEETKRLEVVGSLYDEALKAGLDRASAIVALGGGMVGDLAGFVAATLFRGIRLVQVPTSLLAMVDSSVGGKTAVNLPQGKNLAGSFYQPVEVVADLNTLQTLPDREYASGLAEVVKYGIIWDEAFFRDLEGYCEALRTRDLAVLEEVVARCCEIKAEVVAMDERESGVRAVLNFGHTLAHALELASGYGAWLHGEAVAVGMQYAAKVSSVEKGLPSDVMGRIRALIEGLDLPIRPDAKGTAPSWEEIRTVMATDKKTRDGIPHFVLAEGLGSVVSGCQVGEDTLQDCYKTLCQ